MPLGLLPATNNLARVDSSPNMTCCAPPPWFNAAEGVRAAWLTGDEPFGRTPPSRRSGTPAMRAGHRYERKALTHLKEVFGVGFRSSVWFRYAGDAGIRYCQVDGLLHCEAVTAIFEVKVTFTSDAWWQLRKQYEPVVRKALLPKRLVLVIICKSFDPAAAFPEPVNHLRGLDRQLIERGSDQIFVYSWRP